MVNCSTYITVNKISFTVVIEAVTFVQVDIKNIGYMEVNFLNGQPSHKHRVKKKLPHTLIFLPGSIESH